MPVLVRIAAFSGVIEVDRMLAWPRLVAMAGERTRRSGRLATGRAHVVIWRWFPAAALVVFGHSHIPVDQAAGGQRIFNPGSPTDRRRQPHGTLGVLDIGRGRLVTAAIVEVT
jgi:uncharacterized protein